MVLFTGRRVFNHQPRLNYRISCGSSSFRFPPSAKSSLALQQVLERKRQRLGCEEEIIDTKRRKNNYGSNDVNASRLETSALKLEFPKTKSVDIYSGSVSESLQKSKSKSDDENICPNSHPVAVNTTLSKEQALRVAMLRTRYADTILKAKEKLGLVDTAEKQRLEGRQREEKARIETRARIAKQKAAVELKKQHERDREDARVALEKVEKTVEFEDNIMILKELEMLCGCSLSYPGEDGSVVMMGAAKFKNPLEQLGLFLKDDWGGDSECR